jgi:hypothetical protein
MEHQKIIRDFEAGGYLDLFLVTAVAAVLLIRLFLQLTGFPQLGTEYLHIAHMLWGGLLMLAAIIILLSFLGRTGHKLAAVVGGAGFGMFIDEVGKFVTKDNDYFFRPAPAIIYILIILTYLLIRWIHSGTPRTRNEYLVNALQEAQQVAVGDLDREERDRALVYLAKCDPSRPLVTGLERLMNESSVVDSSRADVITRAQAAARRVYRRLAVRPWFARVVILFFVGQVVVQVFHVFVLLVFHKSWLNVLLRRPLRSLGNVNTRITAFDAAAIGFSALATIFVAIGVWQIKRSRLAAFQDFQRSILVSLLLIQPLMFYRDQWSALIGLSFDIAVFLALRFIIEREERLVHESHASDISKEARS